MSGGHCRSSSVSPAEARICLTPATWKSSPEWLAEARASSSPSSSRPQRSMADACIGLFDDRGNTGSATAPAVSANEPSARKPASVP
jgi:hypothetical protein